MVVIGLVYLCFGAVVAAAAISVVAIAVAVVGAACLALVVSVGFAWLVALAIDGCLRVAGRQPWAVERIRLALRSKAPPPRRRRGRPRGSFRLRRARHSTLCPGC